MSASTFGDWGEGAESAFPWWNNILLSSNRMLPPEPCTWFWEFSNYPWGTCELPWENIVWPWGNGACLCWMLAPGPLSFQTTTWL